MRKYRDYTDDDIISLSKKVTSMAQLLDALGLKKAGGNYANMRRNLQRLNIDALHWKGQGWNKGNRLKDWSDYSRSSKLKPHLITKRGNICECCDINKWNGERIVLEIHHIDGDKTNNLYYNLKLLCPNCHSQTDNWRNKSSKRTL